MSTISGNNPRFKIRVFSSTEGLKNFTQEAASAEDLKAQLESQSLTVISIEPEKTPHFKKSKSKFPLLVFCQQLLSLLDAGLQLVEVVHTLAEKENDARHRAVLEQLEQSLRSGLAFSQALAKYPEIFPTLLQTAIESSEQTGGITDALRRFVSYETQFQTLKRRLMGALIYPALLVSMGFLVCAFLLGYVVPRFSVVFADRIDHMPYLSALIIRLGLSISDNPLTAIGLSFFSIGCMVFLFINQQTREAIVKRLSKLPWLGNQLHAFEVVRIYRALSMLLKGGVPAVQAMQMVVAVASVHSKTSVENAIELIREGKPMSVALKQEGLTTVVSERLLAVGERSGQMAEMMSRAADFLDTELEQVVDRTVKLIEPLMMILIGGLIGAIVILMYLPIFELADSVQ